MNFERLWSAGMTFQDFVTVSTEHKGLWEGVYRLARLPEWAAEVDGSGRRLLVLVEDWCGDASNTVPVLAK
jgi:hypothetical protein